MPWLNPRTRLFRVPLAGLVAVNPSRHEPVLEMVLARIAKDLERFYSHHHMQKLAFRSGNRGARAHFQSHQA